MVGYTLADIRALIEELSVAVELLRRTGVAPAIVAAERFDDGWRLDVSTVGTPTSTGLAATPTA